MSLSGWLVAGAIFIIIFTIALGIGWWIRNNRAPTPAPTSPYTAPFVWGKPVPSSNTMKNTCKLYTFPTAIADVDGINVAIPGAPTFNEGILDNIQGQPIYPRCLDTDQTMAQQVEHTCIAPNGVVDGSITRCFLLSGGTTALGGTETYYTNTNCSKVPACVGQLSLVSINFQAPGIKGIYCLQNEGTGGNITMHPCDPSNPKQLFRITRVDPGQNPNSLQPGQGQNGLLAQILDRNTGLCVVPGNSTTSTIFNPNYLTPSYSGCSGPSVIVDGTNIVLGACTGGGTGVPPGYIWALLPPFAYCPSPTGCIPCIGCQGCSSVPGEFRCEGCNGCYGNPPSNTPPQIAYISNLNLTQIPTGPTGYRGLTGSSAIVQWFRDNNTKSMYYGGSGDGLILAPFGFDVTTCNQKPYTAQYINLSTYNSIITQEACLAADTLGTPYCIGL